MFHKHLSQFPQVQNLISCLFQNTCLSPSMSFLSENITTYPTMEIRKLEFITDFSLPPTHSIPTCNYSPVYVILPGKCLFNLSARLLLQNQDLSSVSQHTFPNCYFILMTFSAFSSACLGHLYIFTEVIFLKCLSVMISINLACDMLNLTFSCNIKKFGMFGNQNKLQGSRQAWWCRFHIFPYRNRNTCPVSPLPLRLFYGLHVSSNFHLLFKKYTLTNEPIFLLSYSKILPLMALQINLNSTF